MRIMIKGGVWKNTEDEILKAAVMKYGKNQWARISSLLVRKSAKQCKARWYEWLDPSIKKTEWTREEDEKLLHLAKLMPTQWRTIAPIVGRTPSQCLERYEKLLDAACTKDENYEPSDDPRKLRPGEIDPNPESKPARPDPVDMDEDEKEMLSEARARLANTRGKKAKRKAREKQLEEARRLASLQKRRELKAAGIDGKQRKRKRKGIDYNAEIPFEKKPPPGFYDVADEERPSEQPKFPTTIEEIEGKRRVDIEAQLRKQDISKNRILQRHDAPASVVQANKLNDPEAVRKRSKLMLPPPQISDRELEEIAKMGYAGDGGLGADDDLVANYGQTPRLGMTPLRTPQRTPAGKGDAIMMEAENQARLRQSQTPLLGGENPELHPSDFSGVTPRKKEVQTPNPMASPFLTPSAGFTPRIGMTPSREFSVTPKRTPIRDGLHINEGMETPDITKSQAEIRKQLQGSWGAIPAPQNEYEIVPPELRKEEAETEEQIEEDMSDRIARQKAEEAERQAAILRKRSKVLQRDLPRPPPNAVDFLKSSLTGGDEERAAFAPSLLEQADELIKKELVALLEHDNAKYPIDVDSSKEKKKSNKSAVNGKLKIPVPEIDNFEEEEIQKAAKLIEDEVSILRIGMGHEDATVEDITEAHDTCLDEMMYFPNRNSYSLASVASISDKLASLQNEFDIVRNHMENDTKKAVRLESKLKVLTQGYNVRAEKLWGEIETTFKQADTAWTELECFRALHKQEQFAASSRIEEWQRVVNQQKESERKLQFRYAELCDEEQNLQRRLADQEEMVAQLREIAKEREKVIDEVEPMDVGDMAIQQNDENNAEVQQQNDENNVEFEQNDEDSQVIQQNNEDNQEIQQNDGDSAKIQQAEIGEKDSFETGNTESMDTLDEALNVKEVTEVQPNEFKRDNAIEAGHPEPMDTSDATVNANEITEIQPNDDSVLPSQPKDGDTQIDDDSRKVNSVTMEPDSEEVQMQPDSEEQVQEADAVPEDSDAQHGEMDKDEVNEERIPANGDDVNKEKIPAHQDDVNEEKVPTNVENDGSIL